MRGEKLNPTEWIGDKWRYTIFYILANAEDVGIHAYGVYSKIGEMYGDPHKIPISTLSQKLKTYTVMGLIDAYPNQDKPYRGDNYGLSQLGMQQREEIEEYYKRLLGS